MTYTAFEDFRKVSSGAPQELAAFLSNRAQGQVLIFDDATGKQIDFPFHEAPAAKVDLTHAAEKAVPGNLDQFGDVPSAEPRGRGRPKLGVVAKEVTLLPRHWDWLNLQPGGASVALRKLVEEARRTSGAHDRTRASQESAYRFMSAVAGNLPGFEEATRALFASDRRRFTEMIAGWPDDVRDYAIQLAFADQA